MRALSNVIVLAAAFVLCSPLAGGVSVAGVLQAQDSHDAAPAADSWRGQPITGAEVKCENGKAKIFDCQDADLLSYLPMSAIGGPGGGSIVNDIWGWIDSSTSREFALVGRSEGTAFVEVTDPVNPKYLGNLALHEGAQASSWRGIKVYKNYAFIVADAAGPHGMQIFDLTQLRDVKNAPVEFKETLHYDSVKSVHTIIMNEATGYAYNAGNNAGGETCGGGLHMVDVRTPTKPTFVGCYAENQTGNAGTGYVHDAQCVVYNGPDKQYQGREICLSGAETAISIADVTDKANPKTISIAEYPNVGYTHQGWFTADQRYFFVNDETDDGVGGINKTRTIVFDLNDLDDPVMLKEFYGTTPATDHNLYILGNYMYQSNYGAGLRIVDVSNPKEPKEVGYFDTFPENGNASGYTGTWSNYPFFKNGVVGVTSMSEGLFMIRHRAAAKQ